MLWPFYPQVKCLQCQLSRKLGGPQSQIGCSDEKNLCPCQESNPCCPAHILVTILTELVWLPEWQINVGILILSFIVLFPQLLLHCCHDYH